MIDRNQNESARNEKKERNGTNSNQRPKEVKSVAGGWGKYNDVSNLIFNTFSW